LAKAALQTANYLQDKYLMKNGPQENQFYTSKKHMKQIKTMLTFICATILLHASAQITSKDSIAKHHDAMMKLFMTKSKYPISTIGIFVYDGYQTLDAMGPYETLANLNNVKIFFIAKNKGFVSNQRGLKIKVDTSIGEVTKLDILVIPGGAVETFKTSQDTAVLHWIKKMDETTTYTTSVCTGAWILASTGLLKDRNVTTNWYRAEEMMHYFGANFKKERYVQDGKYWTSAGVTAGIDMSLAIINELMGKEYTQAAMLNLEYNPKPPVEGGSPDNSEPVVTDMMKEMYDIGLLGLINKRFKNGQQK
jgi:putative intracellular protease/amidase